MGYNFHYKEKFNMAIRITNDEKLIADCEASSLSNEEWYNANGVSTSTFAGWIRSTKDDVCLN